MTFPSHIWLLLITALVVSSIGFKNYVWFISLGYGFSIAAEGDQESVYFDLMPVVTRFE